MPSNIYVYKCVVDDGKAPCVDGGLLSLCICKPQIRKSAAVGDFLIAFGRNSESPPNRLIYAARITERLTGGAYFDRAAYQNRQDCIYERTSTGGLQLKPTATVHQRAAAQLKDIGTAPNYTNAIALVSNDFRYFGDQGTDEWKARAPTPARMIEQLGQGHRVNHSREIRDELRRLLDLVWKQFPQKVNGQPLHGSLAARKRRSTCEPTTRPTHPAQLSNRRVC